MGDSGVDSIARGRSGEAERRRRQIPDRMSAARST